MLVDDLTCDLSPLSVSPQAVARRPAPCTTPTAPSPPSTAANRSTAAALTDVLRPAGPAASAVPGCRSLQWPRPLTPSTTAPALGS